MKVQSENFTHMQGHVAQGCIIVAPSGKEFTLTNTITGWRIIGSDGKEVSGNLKSAYEVEYFIVNGLYSH